MKFETFISFVLFFINFFQCVRQNFISIHQTTKRCKFQAFQETFLWYPQCLGIKENAAKMHECCQIFSLSFSIEDRQKCSIECLTDQEEDEDEDGICCYDKCFAEKTEIYRNKTYNVTALLNSITREKSVSDLEIKIVENSIEMCKPKLMNETKSLFCYIPDFLYKFTQCVLKENYKNCPKVHEDLQCKKLYNVLDECVPLKTTKSTQNPPMMLTERK